MKIGNSAKYFDANGIRYISQLGINSGCKYEIINDETQEVVGINDADLYEGVRDEESDSYDFYCNKASELFSETKYMAIATFGNGDTIVNDYDNQDDAIRAYSELVNEYKDGGVVDSRDNVYTHTVYITLERWSGEDLENQEILNMSDTYYTRD